MKINQRDAKKRDSESSIQLRTSSVERKVGATATHPPGPSFLKSWVKNRQKDESGDQLSNHRKQLSMGGGSVVERPGIEGQ
jgi:hypothetical protein